MNFRSGVGVAWKTADVEPGLTVVIFGLGSIGLVVAEGARLCGAAKIIGVDMNSDKLEIGRQFGITDFVNSKSCGYKPVSQVIIEMTNGGVEYCFECVGLGALVQEAFAFCRKCFQRILKGQPKGQPSALKLPLCAGSGEGSTTRIHCTQIYLAFLQAAGLNLLRINYISLGNIVTRSCSKDSHTTHLL